MKLISHRGNINGGIPERENSPDYILEALQQGFDVEVDIWYTNGWCLGHDNPTYELNMIEFVPYFDKLWFHCKNLDALYKIIEWDVQYFWHQNDDYTLTSKNFIWTFPNKPLTDRSICVLPEDNYPLWCFSCYGICSDYIEKYLYLILPSNHI